MAFVRSLLLFVAACVAAAVLVSKSTPAAAAPQDVVRLSSGSVVGLRTPEFIQVGKRYALTWAGGGPAQTYTVKEKRPDGWILVEVADENTNPIYFVPGELPTRWLNAATAISIQEMRPFP
jgi:hypothetical protein